MNGVLHSPQQCRTKATLQLHKGCERVVIGAGRCCIDPIVRAALDKLTQLQRRSRHELLPKVDDGLQLLRAHCSRVHLHAKDAWCKQRTLLALTVLTKPNTRACSFPTCAAAPPSLRRHPSMCCPAANDCARCTLAGMPIPREASTSASVAMNASQSCLSALAGSARPLRVPCMPNCCCRRAEAPAKVHGRDVRTAGLKASSRCAISTCTLHRAARL